MKPLVFSLVALALVGCGESNEEAYQRGFNDGVEEGAAEVCFEVERVNPALYRVLRSWAFCA